METDSRFYWRRANEEIAYASRAVTPQAKLRHRQLAEEYVRRLKLLPDDPLSELAPQYGSETPFAAELLELLDTAVEWPLPPRKAEQQVIRL